ncbi:MAG: hypothetical protein FJ295_15745 [Planctomycetes bacterium]|nr:hypothetical protein [Planctomycetota bacterium]
MSQTFAKGVAFMNDEKFAGRFLEPPTIIRNANQDTTKRGGLPPAKSKGKKIVSAELKISGVDR